MSYPPTVLTKGKQWIVLVLAGEMTIAEAGTCQLL